MLKVLSFLNKRSDLDLAGFSRYWRSTHKAHALSLVDAGFIRAYAQNHRIEDKHEDLPGLPLMADGAPELWIDDVSALERLVASREYLEGAGPDEANFVRPPVLASVAREVVLIEGKPGPEAIRLMLVVRRDPALSFDAFLARWAEGLTPMVLPGHSPLKLTRHFPLAENDVFDGVECSWWPSLTSLQTAWAARQPRALARLVALDSLRGLVVRQELVVPPQHTFIHNR